LQRKNVNNKRQHRAYLSQYHNAPRAAVMTTAHLQQQQQQQAAAAIQPEQSRCPRPVGYRWLRLAHIIA